MATAFFEFQCQSGMAKQGMEANTSAFIGKVCPAGNEGSARTYAITNMQIFIWGDPAQQYQDQQIVKNIRLNTYKSYFGRSWLVYHEIDNRIDAALDRLGLFPIVSLWQKGRYLLGSSAQQISSSVAKDLSLNPEALGQLLAYGQLLDNQSVLAGAQHHAPGTLISINTFGVLTSRTTPLDDLFKHQSSSFDSALEAFVEAVKKSANASSAPLISLSGGLDSRLILAALQSSGNKAIGLSYGHPKSADVRIANELARSCKFPIFRSQQTKDSNSCGHLTWDTIQRIADLGGGELAVHHAHSLLDRSLLEQSAGRTLLTGTGAETFRAFYFDRGVPGMSVLAIPAFRKQLNARGRRYVFEEYAKTAAPLVAALPDIAEQLGSVRDRAIDNCFNLDLSIANCLNLFYLRYRLPRMVVNGQLALDQHYDRSHPFLDGDVLQQLINLPVRYHLGSGFHLRAINRLSPRLAGIDWDKTNAPLNRGLSFSARYPGLISRLGLTPRWGKANLPMFEYGPWAKTLGPSVLHRALGFLGISGQDQVKATQTLMASPNYHQTMGFCAVWFALLDKTPPHCKDNSRAIA